MSDVNKDRVERLFERLDEERFGPVAVSSPGTLFVCHDSVTAIFKARYPDIPCVSPSELDEARIRSSARAYATCPNISIEEELVATLSRAFPDIVVTPFFGDHVLRIISKCPPDSVSTDALATSELKKVAVFSLPRSGSTHFAGLLTASGVGRCVEHLREPLVRLLLSAPACEPAIERLFRFGQQNGFFSTKIISHFFLDLARKGCNESDALQFFERNHVRAIYLSRKDRVGHALSVLAARKTGVYHTQQPEMERWQYPDYDFDETLRTYRAFERQERALWRFVEQLPHVYRVTYEELCKDPRPEMRRVLDFIGAKECSVAESSGVERMPTGKALEYAERFRGEYVRKFGANP